jgi:hypothetical protein
MASYQLRIASPTRYPSAASSQNLIIPLTWGQTHIADLPHLLLQTNLPNLASALRHGSRHIDVRARLESTLAAYSPSGPERYRKSATAVLNYFESVYSDPENYSSNPLSRYLDKKLQAELDEATSEPKVLRGFAQVMHVARAFGCVNALRMPLEHFLLSSARQLNSELEEWRELVHELGSHGKVREEIERALFAPAAGAEMVVGGGLAELPRGRGFEASLGNSSAVGEWRQSRSIFAVVTPDGLQAFAAQLGPGNTLIPPKAAADGELLDSARDVVCIEIRKLERGQDRLRGKVGEWLLRGPSRGRWVPTPASVMGTTWEPERLERWREV